MTLLQFHRTDTHKKRSAAFTLLELIVVITIIGLLGTLVVTKVAPMLFKANKTKIMYDMQKIYEAAKMIHASTGSYPESLDEMVGATDDEGRETVGLENMPKDPWQNEYGYELRDGKPFVSCLGKDGGEGGENDDQDYYYPEEESY